MTPRLSAWTWASKWSYRRCARKLVKIGLEICAPGAAKLQSNSKTTYYPIASPKLKIRLTRRGLFKLMWKTLVELTPTGTWSSRKSKSTRNWNRCLAEKALNLDTRPCRRPQNISRFHPFQRTRRTQSTSTTKMR